MTRFLKNGLTVIEAEDDHECRDCGEWAETRPYGPGGIELCFKCFAKDPKREAIAKARFGALLDGKDPNLAEAALSW